MNLEKAVEQEKVPVLLVFGQKKKGRTWDRHFPEGGAVPLVTGVFSDLKQKVTQFTKISALKKRCEVPTSLSRNSILKFDIGACSSKLEKPQCIEIIIF